METVNISFQSISAEKVEQNEDLLNILLLRVPAKSLVRFKCVSKRWLSLISDSAFANNHTRNNLNLSVSDDEKFIAFDPTKSPRYKVVFLQISDNDLDELFETDGSCSLYIYHADTYSSKSRTWKRISFSHFGTYPFTEKVFCDGSVYWIDEESKLFKFNIDEEKCEIIQLSSHSLILSNAYRKVMFGEIGGRLFLVQEITPAKFGLRVLEMNMHTFLWNIKFTIDLGPAINTLPAELNIRDLFGVQVLCLKDGDDQENPILIFAIKGKIISYNPNGDRVEILEGVLGDAYGTNKRVHKFIESLATI